MKFAEITETLLAIKSKLMRWLKAYHTRKKGYFKSDYLSTAKSILESKEAMRKSSITNVIM